MSIWSVIKKLYSDNLFVRMDDDGSLFYFKTEDFDGLLRFPFSFKTKAGHRLQGYFYYYGEPSRDRVIVFDHGMGNGHRAYMREIERLAASGYTVYSYDHTGCTESEGEAIRGFSGSLADLDSCITAIKKSEDFGKASIAVVGHSWGGFSTLNITALHPEITHAVAMSGFISVRDAQKQFVPAFLFPYRKKLYELEREANPEYVDSSAIEALSTTKSKVLVIHSTDDRTVSYKKHFLKLKRKVGARDNISFISLSGRDHNPNYTDDAVEYKNAFFLDYSSKKKAGELSTDEAKSAFKAKYDWRRMTEQDDALWSQILEFLRQ